MPAITITIVILTALSGSGPVHPYLGFGKSLLNLSGRLYSLCFSRQRYWKATVPRWRALLFFPAILSSFTATPFPKQAVPTSLAHAVLPACTVSHAFPSKFGQSFQITQ